MKKTQNDTDFLASLGGLVGNKSPQLAGGMIMTEAPSGPSKSLEEILNGAGASPAVNQPDQVLLGTSTVNSETPVASSPAAVKIPVHLVVDSPYQPRRKYDETAIQALGAMLDDRGQDEPITVRKLADGRFELIGGHRRIRAARLIGWGEIDARVVELDDRDAELATLVNNEGRQDLSDYERACSYQTAKDRGFAKTQEELGRLFGCSQARVAQCLGMLKLPGKVKSMLDKYPSLFGYRFSESVLALSKTFPAGDEVIARHLEQLVDTPELSANDFVRGVEKELDPKSRPVRIKPISIPDSEGRSIFSVKVSANQVVIDIKEEFDSEIVVKKTMSLLRELLSSKK
jgi:ParB family chromosome partitioning protein